MHLFFSVQREGWCAIGSDPMTIWFLLWMVVEVEFFWFLERRFGANKVDK